MKKVLAIIIIIIGLAILGFGVFRYFQSKKPSAGLKIETNPPATVFIDNNQIGQTPIDKIFKAGEVSIKLIPASTSSSLQSYQTKVSLVSGVYTVIRRDFNENDSQTAGETVSLEPISSKASSLAVIVSGPDAASVLVDGQPQGFTPLLVSSLLPGDHQITVSGPGFTTRQVQTKAVAGYKLNLNVKLAGQLPVPTVIPTVSPSASPSATPKLTPTPKASSITKPYVEVKDTPTGFLRVREKPATSAKEIGRVNPGDRYSLFATVSGWYQIKVTLDATSSGWISDQYATKFE